MRSVQFYPFMFRLKNTTSALRSIKFLVLQARAFTWRCRAPLSNRAWNEPGVSMVCCRESAAWGALTELCRNQGSDILRRLLCCLGGATPAGGGGVPIAAAAAAAAARARGGGTAPTSGSVAAPPPMRRAALSPLTHRTALPGLPDRCSRIGRR